MRAASRATRTLAALLAVLGVLPATSPAATSRERELRGELERIVQRAGPGAGAYVADARSGRRLFSRRGSTQRSLGSNAKLFTAAAALRGLPPLVTEVLGTAPLAAGGVVDGDLVLRGGGDPGFGAAAAAALAGQVHAAGVRVVTGSVVGDELRFDALRGTPATGNAFHPELGGVLGALTFERGRQVAGGPFLSDPARAAAAAFDDALEALGIVIQGVPRQGVAPPGAIPLGLVSSPVPPLVQGMLKTSDNFVAETLAKALGAQAAGVGTTAAGAAAITSAAQALRARVRLQDGSGLLVDDRASPRAVVTLLRGMRPNAA